MHPVVDEDVPSEEDLWGGPGEAMALEDELQNADLADLDHSPGKDIFLNVFKSFFSKKQWPYS